MTQPARLHLPRHLDLTDKQSRFVELFVDTGKIYESAIASGYSELTAKQASVEVLSRPSVARAIVYAARQRLARTIPMNIGVLEHLRDTAQSEKIRMDCATRLLDRAGIVPPKAEEAASPLEKPLHGLNAEELRAKEAHFKYELSNRAKDVTPSPDAIDLD